MIEQEKQKFEASERSLDMNRLQFRSKALGSGEDFYSSPNKNSNT